MKRVWIEKTYQKGLDHRIKGDRAVGKAIWSPMADKRGADTYKNMREVSAGDTILHLVDNKYINASSVVIDKKINIVKGIEGTPWNNPENYLWNLGSYKKLT